MYPRKRSGLLEKEIDDDLLVLDQQQGKIHQLNATARFVWDCCDGSTAVEVIVRKMAEAGGVADADVEHHVDVAIRRLVELGLLVDAQK